MKKKRLTVCKIREIFRLHFESELSNRSISENLRISKTTVKDVLRRFIKAGLTWPLSSDLTDESFHEALYPAISVDSNKPQPDWEHIRKEMSRRHVTLHLLWEEHKVNYSDGCGRSQFYNGYHSHCMKNIEPTMRQVHNGGEKLFVDFSGDGLTFCDRSTSTIRKVSLFVASWGASSYSFAECSLDRTIQSWICLHKHMFRFFGCAAALTIPDNEKSGVHEASNYEAILQPTYAALGEYYGTAIMPARPRRPRDKATVESNVLHIQRYILGRLRDRRFFSLAEVNDAIKEELEGFNNKPMQEYKVSRKERFEELDRPLATAIPTTDFSYNKIKQNILVGKDYHIEYETCYYSVPYALCGERVEVRSSNEIVEILHKGIRVASHKAVLTRHGKTTIDEHMPKDHRFVKGWSPDYFLSKTVKIGLKTTEVCKVILNNKSHPEVNYRSLMGILSLEKNYTKERLENASERALHFRMPTYRIIRNILEKKLDKEPLLERKEANKTNVLPLSITHENIRGPGYYSFKEQELS